jgi:hypothetical protein
MKEMRMRWEGHIALMGEKKNAYRLLVGKPGGRPRRRWVNNIRMDLGEVGWGGWQSLRRQAAVDRSV